VSFIVCSAATLSLAFSYTQNELHGSCLTSMDVRLFVFINKGVCTTRSLLFRDKQQNGNKTASLSFSFIPTGIILLVSKSTIYIL
jgi:hypothetical protein